MALRRKIQQWFTDSAENSATKPKSDIIAPKYTLKDWNWLHPELQTWQYWQQMTLNTSNLLNQSFEELGDGIYRISIFEQDWYQKWSKEFQGLHLWMQKYHIQSEAPNSMHNYGLIASELGIDQTLQLWVQRHAHHITQSLFPEFESLDHCHGFFVHYGKDSDQSLGFHADDSEITFNFCLGQDFQGSELYFQGRRCFEHLQSPHHPHEEMIIEHIPGTCIVHAGLHRHGVYPIQTGRRQNFILWAKSHPFRKQFQRNQCSDWCGHRNELRQVKPQ